MLKEKLIQKIQQIENDDLIKEIIDLIEFESNSNEVFRLSKAQVEAVEEGIRSVETDGIYSNKEAKSIVEEWFKRK